MTKLLPPPTVGGLTGRGRLGSRTNSPAAHRPTGPMNGERMSVDLVGFLGVVLVAYVVPGPDFLVVVRSATEHPAKGRAAALGAQAGLCVHMLAAAAGLSVIAARSPWCTTPSSFWAPPTWSTWECGRLWRPAGPPAHGRTGGGTGGDPQDGPAPPLSPRGGPEPHRWRAGFTQGFLTNVLNPKAALFFLSVLPQFVDGGGSTARQIFFLGILDVVIGVVYWFALVTVAARLGALLARPTVRHRWELTTGWLFIGIGIGVAATT